MKDCLWALLFFHSFCWCDSVSSVKVVILKNHSEWCECTKSQKEIINNQLIGILIKSIKINYSIIINSRQFRIYSILYVRPFLLALWFHCLCTSFFVWTRSNNSHPTELNGLCSWIVVQLLAFPVARKEQVRSISSNILFNCITMMKISSVSKEWTIENKQQMILKWNYSLNFIELKLTIRLTSWWKLAPID